MASPINKHENNDENPCKPTIVKLQIPFSTPREAEIAGNTLRVDKEPKRGGCQKEIIAEGSNLIVTFSGSELKKVRVAVNSFFECLHMVVRTLDRFGPPKIT